MLRKVLGVIVGYAAMAMFIFLTYSGVYLLMGADVAYEPESYDVSMLWILVSGILGFFAAVFGGFVCSLIAKDLIASKVLAAIVVVLGIIFAVAVMNAERKNEVRTGDVTNIEAMEKSQQPVWVAFANPLIGALGIFLGGGLVVRKKKE